MGCFNTPYFLFYFPHALHPLLFGTGLISLEGDGFAEDLINLTNLADFVIVLGPNIFIFLPIFWKFTSKT